MLSVIMLNDVMLSVVAPLRVFKIINENLRKLPFASGKLID
jgi:hypothetical protein